LVIRSLAIALLVGFGCGEDPPQPLDTAGGDDTGTLPCDYAITWESWAEGFFLNWCTSCHSSDLHGVSRQGAPHSVNFDTYEGAVERPDLVADWATGPKPLMPPIGGPDDDEREILRMWLECGTQ
jgi:hypothetical protein